MGNVRIKVEGMLGLLSNTKETCYCGAKLELNRFDTYEFRNLAILDCPKVTKPGMHKTVRIEETLVQKPRTLLSESPDCCGDTEVK